MLYPVSGTGNAGMNFRAAVFLNAYLKNSFGTCLLDINRKDIACTDL